jgi:hypothetical protein
MHIFFYIPSLILLKMDVLETVFMLFVEREKQHHTIKIVVP